MSNLDQLPQEAVCGGDPSAGPATELLPGAEVAIGTRGLRVTRTLPSRTRRMVGAWCFLDHFGPAELATSGGMGIPPHPHTGLQTVSWLVRGDMLHRDSLGSEQRIRPGQLNLMTAGRAIAHSEESPEDADPWVHGVQLWVALPEEHRHTDPGFSHHAVLPVITGGGAETTVLMGSLAGLTSPARAFSPLVGAEIRLAPGASTELPLRTDFEHAALALTGTAEVAGTALGGGPLLYLGTGRESLRLTSAGGARLLLLGGEPFAEEIVMWWNFVGRSHDEIVADRTEWMDGDRFGVVRGYDGPPLPAPPMPATRLRPRGREPR
jgi:redox-sensitive bicupin YhaK (pirin superfamily)